MLINSKLMRCLKDFSPMFISLIWIGGISMPQQMAAPNRPNLLNPIGANMSNIWSKLFPWIPLQQASPTVSSTTNPIRGSTNSLAHTEGTGSIPNNNSAQPLAQQVSNATRIMPNHPLIDDKQLTANSSIISRPAITEFKCGTVPIYERLYGRSINEFSIENPNSGDFRILHGLDSVPGEWPWIVRISSCDFEDERCGTCTGTLLNSRWLITAGHCGFNRSSMISQFKVTFGLYDLISPENTSFSLPIDRLVVHPQYADLNNDLTLVRLAKPVTFNNHVQPACLLPATRNVQAYTKNMKCYTVGYGLIDGMMQAIKLQKLEINAKQPSECNSDKLANVQLRRGTVCIGPPEGKIGGSCKGDSGGPNLCYEPRAGRWELFGTVSYGPADCDRENNDKWLTVSVDLTNYRSWILATIENLS